MKKYNESSNQEREFKGIWIEGEIWLDYSINACEKVLLAEIDSLDNEPKHCFASNEYFAKFLGVSSRTVTRYISHLEQLGYIYIQDKSKYKNKDYDRIIYSLKSSFVKSKNNDKRGIDKLSNPLRQNGQRGTTKCLNNNTVNKIINNNVVVEKILEDSIKQRYGNTEYDYDEDKEKDNFILFIKNLKDNNQKAYDKFISLTLDDVYDVFSLYKTIQSGYSEYKNLKNPKGFIIKRICQLAKEAKK